MDNNSTMDELDDCRQRLTTLQKARDNLADEYEDLYDAHQTMSITLQDAEDRQDADARLILERARQCKDLQEKVCKSDVRIQALEFALANAGEAGGANWPLALRVTVKSVLWWRKRCRSSHLEKKKLEGRLALLSDEVCPMQCDRMYTHSMLCCGAKICGACLGQWRVESRSCPYCRVVPAVAQALPFARPGTAKNPICLQ